MDKSILKQILVSFASSVIGIDLVKLKKALDKDTNQVTISERMDAVSKNLDESKEVIENTLAEIEKHKIAFENMKQEAELSQRIADMNKEDVEAINTVLEVTLNKQEKKSMPKTILINAVFCIIGAVLGAIFGFIIGKVLK